MATCFSLAGISAESAEAMRLGVQYASTLLVSVTGSEKTTGLAGSLAAYRCAGAGEVKWQKNPYRHAASTRYGQCLLLCIDIRCFLLFAVSMCYEDNNLRSDDVARSQGESLRAYIFLSQYVEPGKSRNLIKTYATVSVKTPQKEGAMALIYLFNAITGWRLRGRWRRLAAGRADLWWPR